MRTTVAGPRLAVETCARRLEPLGVRPTAGGRPDRLVLEWPGAPGGDAACAISWWGPARPAAEPASEARVQAASGLMHLHGRDLGGPRRLGVEVCTVAAGLLAASALLAAAIGRCRGVPLTSVHTSVLQAGLHQAAHHLAAATCPPEEVPPPLPAPGPPFRTADHRWFEIETFDTEAWKAFWLHLGAPADQLGPAWARFRPRYYRGTTSLPAGFHEATARRALAEVAAVARACRVSLSPVRGYDEVRGGAGPSPAVPALEPLAGAGGPGVRAPVVPAGPLPLAGLEVVEATSRMQGPLAGLLLQMLGARVTRVEPPGGDAGRGVPPLAGATGSFFLCFNRGKSTVELDLGRPAGRAELTERVAAADVFLHNWRPGKASEWGLAAEDLGRVNSRLVYVEASGWAPGSEAAPLIGTDFLVQAWTGLANALHPEPDPPLPSRVLLADFTGALVTAEGALAGLYRRQQRGTGCRVATSLEAGAMALQAHVLDDDHHAAGTFRRRGRPVWRALDVPVAASDGSVVIDADEAGLDRLCRLCGIDAGGRSRADLEDEVAKQIAGGTVAEWEERLACYGIGCEPVATDLAAIPDDPRLAPLFQPLAGSCRAPAAPWHLEP